MYFDLLNFPKIQSEDRQKAGIAWARIRAALDVLRVSEDEQKSIWCVLAAVYHLGTASAVRGQNYLDSSKHLFIFLLLILLFLGIIYLF